MTEIEIEIVDAQPLERLLACLDHVLARKPALRRLRIAHRAEVDLARHAPRVAREAQIREHVAHDALGFARGVRLRVVEEVDPAVERERDQIARFGAPDAIAERDPRAERERGELQTRRTETAVFHREIPAC